MTATRVEFTKFRCLGPMKLLQPRLLLPVRISHGRWRGDVRPRAENMSSTFAATTQCQACGGSSPGDSVDELRWDVEIARTLREILLSENSPAQALHSSSAGSRTGAIQDIWSATPKSYLQPVDSPELDVTPYRSWTVAVPADTFRRVVAIFGFTVGGDITDVSVVGPEEGEGPSQVEIRSELSITSIPVSRIRAIFNVHGPTLCPGLFPGPRPSGRRWPQTILSYTFETRVEGAVRRQRRACRRSCQRPTDRLLSRSCSRAGARARVMRLGCRSGALRQWVTTVGCTTTCSPIITVVCDPKTVGVSSPTRCGLDSLGHRRRWPSRRPVRLICG